MQLTHGLQLAYCTNIHRAETWADTLASLERYTLAVKARVAPDRPYAIGLRLGKTAARELSDPGTLSSFRDWLDRHGCYVFTINGFPYGQFHGTRVKEQVYAPDWTTPERLTYTNLLFDLLAQIVPVGVEGSVSTVPGSFKEFIRGDEDVREMRKNLWRCLEHIHEVSERSGRRLHLGLEPEPLCYLETSDETARFFEEMRHDRPCDHRIEHHLGVNYDTCHLAIEFEEPVDVLARLRRDGVPLSKIHLSSALKLSPTPSALATLAAFVDETYFHQVIVRRTDGSLLRYRDLPEALHAAETRSTTADHEWRIHFHVPLQAKPAGELGTTVAHLTGVLDAVATNPALCRHFEMETYTWEVLPPALRSGSVVDQLVAEHEWTLAEFGKRGIQLEPAA